MSNPITKTFVVTGASRGLGLEFVRQLSDVSHHHVIAVVRSPEIAEQLNTLGRGNVSIVKADLSDLKSFPVRECKWDACSEYNAYSIKDVATKISKVANGKIDVLIK
ncbi:hypothetical protein JDV02_005567 [Purpureocillium takamizusanense]|uniref:NAD(P)-binding domain-containing protein n=1 Tax=Purpureocillium takamizusanense TaxID=2060973 RepID=A0A9Q8VC18_9HYPO|nr:uncharacterized protein JDV02_005567 [Purpureocillium takamizusanense]UNI19382.1 hypothetical protein JDV02_005567 [Purpureocillium takamizusanense]